MYKDNINKFKRYKFRYISKFKAIKKYIAFF